MTDSKKITLINESEQEVEFTVVDYLEIEDKRYIVLLPDEDPDDGAIILRVESDEDGEDILVEIEDDDEFDEVVKILEEDED